MISETLKTNPQGFVFGLTCAASHDCGVVLPPSKNSPLVASTQKVVVSVSIGVSKFNPEPTGVVASSELNQNTCPPFVSASRMAVVPSHASIAFVVTVNVGSTQSELMMI